MQLGNHLGNVLVTISDKKKGVADPLNAALIKFFEPYMLSGTDYYPFGMAMRVGGDNKYKYGFNGQEMSNEIKGEGNSYTAEFWEYDPRIGRRWNVDPVVKEYESPYAVFGNNPIWNIDVDGADTSKYLNDAQLVDAMKIGYNVIKSHMDKKTFNMITDYSSEINDAAMKYWEDHQSTMNLGAFAEFRQQAIDYHKGFKEVAASVDGDKRIPEFNSKVLLDWQISSKAKILMAQTLIGERNGQMGSVAGEGAKAFTVIMSAANPEVGAGPRSPKVRVPPTDKRIIKEVALRANINGKIAKSGMSNREAEAFFGWKTGKVTKSASDFTRPLLEQNGWTKEIIKELSNAYWQVARSNSTNPSAMPRAKQLTSLLKLFE